MLNPVLLSFKNFGSGKDSSMRILFSDSWIKEYFQGWLADDGDRFPYEYEKNAGKNIKHRNIPLLKGRLGIWNN